MISFSEFVQAVHHHGGRTPYPWQERFAERCATGTPPSLVGVPTGCGKTTVVDALVWALACQVNLPHGERSVGARIVWAIDRRILVDEVHAHASALAECLLAARDRQDDPLHETAQRLSAMSGDVPLVATRWRGGVASDRSLYPPTQAQVITSTVAQVGSRLLFRGYGVGRPSLSVEAALAACDTTICLDEAHLVEPFRQTIDAIRAHRANTERELPLPGLELITLTATPEEHGSGAILLDDDDREEPELQRRLRAEKWARLEEAPPTERERVKLIAEKTTDHVHDGAPTVACVVNTVKRAREVFDVLARALPDDEVDLALLVGPQRPADRELLLVEHGDVLFRRGVSRMPLICVATQTFEVGLDADVAAMVTDSASASALVQRLGRLNRGGHGTGQATIIRDESSWLYEADEPLAWSWLRSLAGADGTVDVSVAALEADRSRPRPTRVRSAPSLTSAAIELLVQTNPQPGRWQEPSVEGFLRGAEDQSATDVTVCWRCDLLPFDGDPAAEGYREMLLELVPPQAREQLTLSVNAARALLAARYPSEGKSAKAATVAVSDADVEGESEHANIPEPGSLKFAVPFLVIRRREVLHGSFSPADDGKVVARSLQPGDTVVIPVEAGGVDQHGLAPAAGPHAELGDVAGDRRRGPELSVPVPVRISPAALGSRGRDKWFEVRRKCRAVTDGGDIGDAANAVEDLADELARILPDHDALSLLTRQRLSGLDEPVRLLLRAIGPVGEDDLPRLAEEEIEALEGENGEEVGVDDGPAAEGGSAEGGSAEGGSAEGVPHSSEPEVLQRTWVLVPVARRERERQDRDSAHPPPTLDAHATAVRAQVEGFMENSALPGSIRSALLLAAAAHDHGKADLRTQAFFHGGVRPLTAEPIAKSVFGTNDPRTEKLARATAGLPRGLRHELASVAVLSEWLDTDAHADIDRDLVLHLVAGHHGQGRPVPRTPRGGEDALRFYVDAAGVHGTAIGDGQDGWADGEWLRRFWRVIDRYGEWGAAYLESLLVLADRTVSARGE